MNPRSVHLALVGVLVTLSVINSSGAIESNADSLKTADSSPQSITSVHQVWTSSSSGSLNELSPEIIGKLHNDVPFLAAYALRPRLVGAMSPSLAAYSSEPSNRLASDRAEVALGESSSSSAARQSLVPKLGDFSEFNVETSSLSKSEHHHKRKTNLKRRAKAVELDRNLPAAALRRRILAKASRLVRQRRNHRHEPITEASKRPSSSPSRATSSRSRTTKRKSRRARAQAGRLQGASDENNSTVSAGNSIDESEGAIEDEPKEPKRVGDGDVEEGGDTVMVEPKFDGLDDDPPLPTENEDERPETEREGADKGVAGEEADERDTRVGRERPDQEESDGSQVAGGGIGATIGGGGRSSGSSPWAKDPDNQGSTGDRGREGSSKGSSPGVELANENDGDGDDDRNNLGSSAGDSNFGTRHMSAGASSSSSGSGSNSEAGVDSELAGGRKFKADREANADEDLDYRDELAEAGRRGRKGAPRAAGGSDGAERKLEVGGRGSEHCDDDGSYKAHDEKYHDEHHHTGDWLRGSIPGEPEDDYPILSRINQSTNFKCRDHKLAGYYADVESRCQVGALLATLMRDSAARSRFPEG